MAGRNADHFALEVQAKIKAQRELRKQPTTIIRPKQPVDSAANPYRTGSAN